MTDSPKKLSQKLMRKNRLSSAPSLKTLENLIQNSGFTIIEFNKYNNTPEVNEIIQTLGIEDRILSENSFVYIDRNIEFVFINADLKTSEKTILLCHELGHICDKRINEPRHIYSHIEREHFANEFAHYMEYPSFLTKIVSTFLRRKLICTLILVLLFLAIGGICVKYNPMQTGDVFSSHQSAESNGLYYVTDSGKRYHKDFCKHIKYKTNKIRVTLNEAVSRNYTPCLDCIGE